MDGFDKKSDHGSQFLSIRYTERLIEANIEASVSSIGDSYDNALAETINGLRPLHNDANFAFQSNFGLICE
ncbi:hypothetical protein C8R26_103136 [Nitrosomonas oligotropha]|uniref:Transposase n=1 Tax=Nitrosomonas oligotropha TaxID=42354 RepID=A0A2T5I3H4_9PROT|nr:hypothetical protein C8R26_103136 [Nitrosomonas oligotropha]